jgi:predicted regulator of Ras-like GTPase activity (Roadblock/LC7/MglB family)
MNKKKRTIQEAVAEVTEPVAIEETVHATNLRANLDEIKTYEGVIGYILRNTTSAAIDLKDPTKIVDYAVLSSSALDALKSLTELFDLGNPQSIVVEGKDAKMLSMTIQENRISIFMEKNADCERILGKLNTI